MAKTKAAAWVAITLMLVAACSATKDRECTVREKDRTTGDMRVYTSCGVFRVGDHAVNGNRSADLYGSLQPGRTYWMRTKGIRSGPSSSFPSIIDASEVTPR